MLWFDRVFARFGVKSLCTPMEIMWLYANAKRYASRNKDFLCVEIGTYQGATTLVLGKAVQHSDNPGGCVITIDNHRQDQSNHINGIINESGMSNIITVVNSDDLEYVSNIKDLSVSMLFVDSNHSPKHTLGVMNSYIPKVKSGGILACHDYDPIHYGVVDAVNKWLSQNDDTITGHGLWHKIWWAIKK